MTTTRLLLAALALSACASGRTPPTFPDSEAGPGTPAVEYRGVPGFDIRDYPGDGVMARWREASPYRWVGFYLPAPCYTGTSWNGKRAQLRELDWGLAVLYVGEQDWRAMGAPPEMTDSTAAGSARCSSANLTAENGAAHARDAAARAQEQGFGAGTPIYLDVERVDDVSPELAAYVGAWIGALLDDARYLPGIYAHARNADVLMNVARAAYEERARSGGPRLWVASADGFDLTAAPAESGIAGATIWQGAFDREERWGDVTLRIDANVGTRGEF